MLRINLPIPNFRWYLISSSFVIEKHFFIPRIQGLVVSSSHPNALGCVQRNRTFPSAIKEDGGAVVPRARLEPPPFCFVALRPGGSPFNTHVLPVMLDDSSWLLMVIGDPLDKHNSLSNTYNIYKSLFSICTLLYTYEPVKVSF